MFDHSASLSCMINDEMIEAQREFAILDDVDEDIIQRFIEWAYKRYYIDADFHQKINRPSSLFSRTKDNCESIKSISKSQQVFFEKEAFTLKIISIDDLIIVEVIEEVSSLSTKSNTVQHDFQKWSFKTYKFVQKNMHKAK